MSHWLRLSASDAGGVVLIPSPGTEIPYGVWNNQKKFRKPFLKVVREELIYIYLYIFMA